MTLLPPGITVVVVAELLPEARLVVAQEGDAPYPLGALPEIEMRNQEPSRTSVLGLQLSVVEAERDPRLVVLEILQRQVGRVAPVGTHQRVRSVRLDTSKKRVEGHAF